jgi:hypothetical protein
MVFFWRGQKRKKGKVRMRTRKERKRECLFQKGLVNQVVENLSPVARNGYK